MHRCFNNPPNFEEIDHLRGTWQTSTDVEVTCNDPADVTNTIYSEDISEVNKDVVKNRIDPKTVITSLKTTMMSLRIG